MADETFYKYTSNKDPNDGTTQVVAAVDEKTGEPTKVLVRGGDSVALTEDEHARVSARFNLRKDSDGPDEDTDEQVAEREAAELAAANAAGAEAGPQVTEQADLPTSRANARGRKSN